MPEAGVAGATNEMKLSPQWLREFVDPKADNLRLADDLTSVGIAVEGITGEGENTVFEMEIGTNRPDAMNHYGVAREASAIYNLPLRPIARSFPASQGAESFQVEIADQAGCARYTARIVRDVNIKPRLPIHCEATGWSISARSTTPPTPPTTPCGRWDSLPTSSISICSKAARFWCGGLQRRNPQDAGWSGAQADAGRSGHCRRGRNRSRWRASWAGSTP